MLEASPTKRLGLLQSYAVPVKGGSDDFTAGGDRNDVNSFVVSKSLPDFEPSFFDRAMKMNSSGTNSEDDITTMSNSQDPISTSQPLFSSTTPTQQIEIQVSASAGSSPSRTILSGDTILEDKDDPFSVVDQSPDTFDHIAATPCSVKSVEGYISMAKPTITDSGGYVKMQPSLLPSYSQAKSPLNAATTSVCAVGQSSNSSDLEQSIRELKLLSPESQSSPRQSPEPTSDHSGGQGSMENLFDVNCDVDDTTEEEKNKGRKKIKRRIKRFFRRHRSVESPSKASKKNEGDGISPTSSVSTSLSGRKPRSLSNVEHTKVIISEDNNVERELSPPTPSKPRSVSENDAVDQGATGYPVKRSYTMLTNHITNKYKKKVLDKLRTDSGASSGSGVSETSPLSPVRESAYEEERDTVQASGSVRGMADLTPPSKMSPPRYRGSLYCDQLKYKLRAALQNIHTPLSLSPIYLQLRVDDDAKCDSRYQLILLIQHALQRSRWRHDVMEIALLTELLKMIDPLPNEL